MHSHRIVIALAALAAVLLSLLPAAPTAADTVPWGDRLEDLEGTDVVIVLKFRQTPVEDILEILWRMAPIEAHYVGDLPDRPIDVELESVTMAEALKHLGLLAGLRYRVVGPRELEVHPVLRAGEDGVLYPSLIPESQVQPIYPEDARQQQLQGKVILQAIIDRTGTVGDILVLSSDPPGYEPFIQSAISAVGQWRYEPATRDGEPQDVSFSIVIEFQLNDEDLAAK